MVTKRIHNRLHGAAGDGGPLGEAERGIYERTLRASAAQLASIVRSRDIVYCHDPQTADLVSPLLETGATVVWRCHVGIDLPNETARETWAFLRDYVRPAHAYVFSRRAYAWEGLERADLGGAAVDRRVLAEEQDLAPEQVRATLARVGIGPRRDGAEATFERADGSPGRVDRVAEIDQDAPVPADAPLVAQVSRWDRLRTRSASCADSPSTPEPTKPTSCSPGRASPRYPTTPRVPRSWPGQALRDALQRRRAPGCTSPACRWTTCRRTPR